MSDNDAKEPKPIYKKVWFWGLGILIVLTAIGIIRGPGSQEINRQQVNGISTNTPPGGGVKADDYSAEPDKQATNTASANESVKQQENLDLEISTENTQYGQALILAAGEPFTLQRIVFNGRAEEKNCDLPKYGLSAESTDTSNEGASIQSVYGTQLPKQLKTGDRAVFFSGCGQVMKFDLYTDRGVFNYTPHR